MAEMLAGMAQSHSPEQRLDPNSDDQPSDHTDVSAQIGASLLSLSALNISSDDIRPTLYQTEEGLKRTPPPSIHEYRSYRRGQFADHKSFDFSKLPPGATSKEMLEHLVGHSVTNAQFANARAFLDTTAYSEGTSIIGFKANGGAGYDVQVGGRILASLSHHPGEVVRLNDHLSSSAAGRYQFLGRTWQECASNLGLRDFLPPSQDIAALYLMKRAGSLDDILAGRFEAAVHRDRGIWASFPGAGYGQHEQTMALLKDVYRHAGGRVEGEMAAADMENIPLASAGNTETHETPPASSANDARPPAPSASVSPIVGSGMGHVALLKTEGQSDLPPVAPSENSKMAGTTTRAVRLASLKREPHGLPSASDQRVIHVAGAKTQAPATA